MPEETQEVEEQEETGEEESQEEPEDTSDEASEEESQEEQEVDDEEEDEDEEGIDPESPLMDTIGALGEIDKQLKRLRKKNITNVRYELQFSVYPILQAAIEGLLNWALELEGEEAEEDAEEVIAAGAEELKEICEKIMKLEELGVRNQNLDELVAWAEEKLRQLTPNEEVKEAQDE